MTYEEAGVLLRRAPKTLMNLTYKHGLRVQMVWFRRKIRILLQKASPEKYRVLCPPLRTLRTLLLRYERSVNQSFERRSNRYVDLVSMTSLGEREGGANRRHDFGGE